MFAGSLRMIALAAAISASVWACSTFQNRAADQNAEFQPTEGIQKNQEPQVPEGKTVSREMESLKALMIDLAAYNVCERLKGRYHLLSSGGSSPEGSKKANTGVIRIDTCNAREIDPKHLRIDLSGIGWQWISRGKEQLGATFKVEDNAKFAVDISMVGTFDTAYDQAEHILTLWFVPTQPVDVNLRVRGGIDVDPDSIWSSIVGIAGSITGKSPEERAEKTIRKQGGRLFQSKLSSGLTLIVDLCSGKHYFKLGTFPAGELPENATPGKPYPANGRGVLHTGSMLAAGPFDTDKPITARFKAVEGGVRVSLVCERDAEKVARAYVNSTLFPGFKPLAEKIIRPGRPGTLRIKSDQKCRVVLLMRPLIGQTATATFNYTVYHEGAKSKPLVDCSRE